jgi:MFS family permease
MAFLGFRLLLAGTVLTQMGQWMQQVALGWLVLDLTGSAFYLGLASFLRSIPMLFLSLPGGILADRVHRGRLLGIAQGFAAFFALVLAILIASGSIQIWHVLALSVLSGSAMALVFPVRQALVPAVVTRRALPNAIALNSAGNNVTRMLGPSVAGILISLVGVAVCFFVQTIGLFLALWTSLTIRLPERAQPKAQTSALADLAEAYRYIRGDRAMFGLILAAAVPTVFGMPYISFMPAVARDLGIGATGLGLLLTSVGVGSVLGSTGFAIAGDFRRKGLVQLACVAAFGASLVAFSLTRWLPASLMLLAMAGVSSSVYMATNNTLLQTRSPDALRGRIMSVYMLTWGLMPLGTLPLGVLAEGFGSAAAVCLGGALCFVFAIVVAYLQPEVRRLE